MSSRLFKLYKGEWKQGDPVPLEREDPDPQPQEITHDPVELDTPSKDPQ